MPLNPEIERATIRIATEEVNQILRQHGIAHRVNAQVKQECIDRIRQVIDIAVQGEVEMIERDLQV